MAESSGSAAVAAEPGPAGVASEPGPAAVAAEAGLSQWSQANSMREMLGMGMAAFLQTGDTRVHNAVVEEFAQRLSFGEFATPDIFQEELTQRQSWYESQQEAEPMYAHGGSLLVPEYLPSDLGLE